MAHDGVIDPSTGLTASELGSILGRMSHRITKPCRQCGQDCSDVTVRKEFCSPKCRQKNWRDRQKALRPGEQMEYFNRRNGSPSRQHPTNDT